ncbi:hypothetical protein REPUB_Repub13aG0257600 [Reevesia pubescens]
MSYLTRVFRRTISTTPTPQPDSVRKFADDLYKERNLKLLVLKFKKSCEYGRFRKRNGIYEDTVRRLASAGRFRWIEEILEEQKKYDDISKEGFAARLINLYGKSGMFEQAYKVFDEMPNRGLLSFNALMGACMNAKKFDKVNGFFKELPEKLSIKPDLVSYNTVIKAFCEMGTLDSALSMLDEMDKKEKRMEEAVNFVEEMKSKGVKLDVFTFNYVIRGFVNEGRLEEAKQWYCQIGKNDCAPDKLTFTMLVPFLCEKGDLRFAIEVCKEIFGRKKLVGPALLQRVVDELVKASMIEDAKELVKLAKTNTFCRYRLNMPAK